MAPARDLVADGARHAGGDPLARAAGHPQKELRGLIPVTLPEVRRLLVRCLLTRVPCREHALDWSRWHRRHQHRAKLCHYRARGPAP